MSTANGRRAPVRMPLTTYPSRNSILVLLMSLCSSVMIGHAFSVGPSALVLRQHQHGLSQTPHYIASTRLFVASSFDRGDALNTTEDTIGVTTTTATPLVQRHYKTFLWKHNLQEFDINYRVEGPVNGPPILLIHGFGANVNHFRHQFPFLAEQGYRVYAIDLLGFGASDKPGDVDYSSDLYVQLAKDFINTMQQSTDDDKQWVVAGNSIGGLISLGVAEAMPKLINGVILFNTAGGMTGFRYSDVPAFVRPLLWFFQKVLLGPRMGSTFFSNFKTRSNVEFILKSQGVYKNTTNVDDELLEILIEPSDDEGAEAVFLKTFAGDPGPTPEEILPHLECPVMAIWGGSDPWTPVDGGVHPGNKFHEYSHDFELHTIPKCGHCPHDEAPDDVNRLMLTWLDGLETKKKEAAVARET